VEETEDADMMIFIYTFVMIFVALILILALGSIITGISTEPVEVVEGEATAAMCTTQLLDRSGYEVTSCDEDFVIEQDMVYTFDSINL
jgi:hypothetical protein